MTDLVVRRTLLATLLVVAVTLVIAQFSKELYVPLSIVTALGFVVIAALEKIRGSSFFPVLWALIAIYTALKISWH